MGVSNPQDDLAERNLGLASVPRTTVNPRVGNTHLQQNPILDSYIPAPSVIHSRSCAQSNDVQAWVINRAYPRLYYLHKENHTQDL